MLTSRSHASTSPRRGLAIKGRGINRPLSPPNTCDPPVPHQSEGGGGGATHGHQQRRRPKHGENKWMRQLPTAGSSSDDDYLLYDLLGLKISSSPQKPHFSHETPPVETTPTNTTPPKIYLTHDDQTLSSPSLIFSPENDTPSLSSSLDSVTYPLLITGTHPSLITGIRPSLMATALGQRERIYEREERVGGGEVSSVPKLPKLGQVTVTSGSRLVRMDSNHDITGIEREGTGYTISPQNGRLQHITREGGGGGFMYNNNASKYSINPPHHHYPNIGHYPTIAQSSERLLPSPTNNKGVYYSRGNDPRLMPFNASMLSEAPTKYGKGNIHLLPSLTKASLGITRGRGEEGRRSVRGSMIPIPIAPNVKHKRSRSFSDPSVNTYSHK